MDRRNKERVDLRLSCRIDGTGSPSEKSGQTTENISRNGLLLRWTRNTPVPELGADLRVEVELPSQGAFGPRLIRCESTVVRIIPGDEGHSRIALRVHTMRFVEDSARLWQGNWDAATPVQERVN
jgi:c-di-GMP-binding flagellar brake protein YcgR